MWAKRSNKKGWANKSHQQQQINKKENGDTKSNIGVQLFDGKWMCLCNKGCGFNNSHTTGFHNTWASCVKKHHPPHLA